jgi:eukaryotic-like serine/threonine-protein kinase
MTLSAGARIGPYEVLGLRGIGGMGEVYAGRDTRLDRRVAIKILSAPVGTNAKQIERFQREARAIARVSHPRICAVYDVGQFDGDAFLVMELLEGETLAERLKSGPLSLERTLAIGAQIADALAAAHRHGVTHRDLKPANVMLTPDGVKLLDFGVAKLRESERNLDDSDPANTLGLTAPGTMLGTLPYMAPEQVEGREADGRTDIFALGIVLYEMASGHRPFQGDSRASLAAAILKEDPPPVSTFATLAPASLDRVVKRCLAKDPDERWQSARDVAAELRWVLEADSADRIEAGKHQARDRRPPVAVGLDKRRRLSAKRVAQIAAATIVILLSALGAYQATQQLREASPPARVMRFQFSADSPITDLAVSPDARMIAFVTAEPGNLPAIWLRSLDRVQPRKLTGTEGASTGLFWSPDARFIAFISGGWLRKIAVDGGSPQALCGAPNSDGVGGSWNTDGTIVFGTFPSEGLLQIPASGGEARLVTKLDARLGEEAHAWPRFLDTRRFLYAAVKAGAGQDDICVGSLDSMERRCLDARISRFDYSPPGVIVFPRRGELLAQTFDATALRLVGEPSRLVDRVSYSGGSLGAFFAVSNSVLAVRPEEAGRQEQLTWYDQHGRALGTLGSPDSIDNFDLSPDGRRIAIARASPDGTGEALLVTDIARGVTSLLAGREFAGVNDPVWSPDGDLIAFTASRSGSSAIIVRPADGGVERVLIERSSGSVFPEAWSPDGRHLAISVFDGPRHEGALLALHGKPEPIVFADGESDEADFSPDGRWLAYSSRTRETGQPEVFVVPVPPTGSQWQVSTTGGAQPRWRPDGRELYYLALDGTLSAVTINRGARFDAGSPRPLFKTGLAVLADYDQFDVAPDGRFLISKPADASDGTVIDVMLNWQSGLIR